MGAYNSSSSSSSSRKHTKSAQCPQVHVAPHLLSPPLCFLVLLELLVGSFGAFPRSVSGCGCRRQQAAHAEASPPPSSRLLLRLGCWRGRRLPGLLLGGRKALVERTRALARFPRGLGLLLAGAPGAAGRGCGDAGLLAGGGRGRQLGGVGATQGPRGLGRLELLQGLELLQLLEGVDVLLGRLARRFGGLGALRRGCSGCLRLHLELGQLFLDRLRRHGVLATGLGAVAKGSPGVNGRVGGGEGRLAVESIQQSGAIVELRRPLLVLHMPGQ